VLGKEQQLWDGMRSGQLLYLATFLLEVTQLCEYVQQPRVLGESIYKRVSVESSGTHELKYKDDHHSHKLSFTLYARSHAGHYVKQVSSDTQ
jgi:hypothetical protein